MDEVILVDRDDREVGTMEKMEAHRRGLLHRAFSILVFNSKGELLLQKRAMGKYHSGGLWTNTCCSHPRPGEDMVEATKRKLMQEMGIVVEPSFVYKFLYQTGLAHGLTEHELDHVYVGHYEGEPRANAEEVEAWRYVGLETLLDDIQKHPEAYTYWFRVMMERKEVVDCFARAGERRG